MNWRRYVWIPALLASWVLPGHAQQAGVNWDALLGAGKALVQSQQVGSMRVEDEVALGADMVGRMLGQYPAVQSPALQRYVNQVGTWLATHSSRPELPWRFVVVKSDGINAFAAPGGTVLVTLPMFQQLQDEAELACVLGHEIAHISHRHHLSVVEKSLMLDAGVQIYQAQADAKGTSALRDRVTAEGKTLLGRKLDRSAETQADQDGMLLAARAGYDPGACLGFMQRLAAAKAQAGALAALYKTHPQASERVQDIEAALPRLQGAASGDGARPVLLVAATTPAAVPARTGGKRR